MSVNQLQEILVLLSIALVVFLVIGPMLCKKKSNQMLDTARVGDAAIDNLWRYRFDIIDRSNVTPGSELWIPDDEVKAATQQFCHGCGATIKAVGIHNCKYCGTLVNAVSVAKKKEN